MSDEVPNPYNPDGKKIIFYDALNDLKSLSNLDIYVTGSNSKMLSSDILTEFRGRSDEIRVHPLSFAEYYSAVGGDKQDAFDEFANQSILIHNLKDKEHPKELLTEDVVELPTTPSTLPDTKPPSRRRSTRASSGMWKARKIQKNAQVG